MAEYIEREALLQQLEMAIECKDCPRNADRKTYYDRCACSEIQDICDAITEAPKADVQPVRHGRWLNNHSIWIEQPEIEGYFVQAECSECGRWAHEMKPYTRFLEYEKCPHCGADMTGGAENDRV